MKNIDNKSDFERQWEDAFRDVEMSPPEHVWDKIDSTLSQQEAGYFRRKAFYFKLLAAASIAFALGVGAISMNYYLKQEDASLAQQSIEIDTSSDMIYNDPLTSTSVDSEQLESATTTYEDSNLASANNSSDGKVSLALIDEEVEENYNASFAPEVNVLNKAEDNRMDNVPYLTSNRNEVDLKEIAGLNIDSKSSEEYYYQIDHIYLIPIMPRGSSKSRKEVERGIFTAGLDFSTGVFDPNFEQSGGGAVFASSGFSAVADTRVESYNDQLTSFNTTNKDFLLVRSAGNETQPEIAFSYGANVGFKLSRRVVLQTGVAYRIANTTVTTTGYIAEQGNSSRIPIVASYQYQLDGLSSVNRISETDLSNQYEFASIPLRAGYMLLDRKFNITLMAGISSEFFLNNKIVDENDYLETISSSSGDGTPYKNVYFNGSLGTILGYTFAKNYQISLEPSYRVAVNSFTRDDFYLNSYPSSFMLSFGLAYNFK